MITFLNCNVINYLLKKKKTDRKKKGRKERHGRKGKKMEGREGDGEGRKRQFRI